MCMKYMCESTCICVLEYIHGCVFVVYMSCLCLCVHEFTHTHMGIVSMYSVFMNTSVCATVCAYMYVYMCVYVCECICMCML